MFYPINSIPFLAGEMISDSRRADESMLGIGEEEQRTSRTVVPATRRTQVTLSDLFFACRQRYHHIISFALRDLNSKLPPKMTSYLWDRTLTVPGGSNFAWCAGDACLPGQTRGKNAGLTSAKTNRMVQRLRAPDNVVGETQAWTHLHWEVSSPTIRHSLDRRTWSSGSRHSPRQLWDFNFGLLVFFFFSLSFLSSSSDALSASKRPTSAPNGMVVSTNAYASEVGVEILKRTGSAVDAAVAVAFALAVVHPSAGNLGGGGFMVIHDALHRKEISVDYREVAPRAASRNMYLDEAGNLAEELSTAGYLASGVPGSVAGLHLAWRKFGRLSWVELINPSIQLARNGFVVSASLSHALQNAQKLLTRFRHSKRIFLRGGDFYQEGEIFRQPELAETLQRIAQEGPSAFYDGPVARLIADDMGRHGGNITLEDLKDYQPKLREPLRGTYRGYDVISMAPPSSGGIVLLEMLNMIEPYPVGALEFHSSQSLHLLAEVMRRAFADRARFLGDADFSEIPVRKLISKQYAHERSKSIRKDWASVSSFLPQDDPVYFEPAETTHYSVVDQYGNGVAVTTTINGAFGSGVTIKGAGFLMNNQMDDFSSKPGTPNLFGLIQGEANTIAPGKRPLSSMTPTLVKKDDELLMVMGSPGGPTIINTVFQIILNVIDYKLDIQKAVSAPRIHHQWQPDQISAEPEAMVRDVEIVLQERGHKIAYRQSIGNAHCIFIEPITRVLFGAPDPRSESKASGH